MTITIPPELDWVAALAVGQTWPAGDEDQLAELGDAWRDTHSQLTAINHDIAPMASGMRDALSGPTAEQFGSFVKQLNTTMPTLVDTSAQMGDMSHETAVQTQYSKLMILLQLAWMAEQLLEWAPTVWGAALVPEIEAIGELMVSQIAKRFVTSVASATAIQTGMDSAVQAFQMFVLKDRDHWDTSSTVSAVEMGLLSGGIGAAVHEIGHAIAPDFVNTLKGKVTVSAVTGVTSAVVTNAAFGGGQDLGLAFGAGVIGGFLGGKGPHEQAKEPPALDLGSLHALGELAHEVEAEKNGPIPHEGLPGLDGVAHEGAPLEGAPHESAPYDAAPYESAPPQGPGDHVSISAPQNEPSHQVVVGGGAPPTVVEVARRDAGNALTEKHAAHAAMDNAQSELAAAHLDVATQKALEQRLTTLSQPELPQTTAQKLRAFADDPVAEAAANVQQAGRELSAAHADLAQAQATQLSHAGLNDARVATTDASRVSVAETRVAVAERQATVAQQVRDLVAEPAGRQGDAAIVTSGEPLADLVSAERAATPSVETIATASGGARTESVPETAATSAPESPDTSATRPVETQAEAPRPDPVPRKGIVTLHDLPPDSDASSHVAPGVGMRQPDGSRTQTIAPHALDEPAHEPEHPGSGFDTPGERLGGQGGDPEQRLSEVAAEAAASRASAGPETVRVSAPDERLAQARADFAAARQNLAVKTAAERRAVQRAAAVEELEQQAREAAQRASEPAPRTPEPVSHAAEPEVPRVTPAQREQAWQSFVDRIRGEHPGGDPVREGMTWREATDWVEREVERRVEEAAGTFWNQFDTQAHREYVAHHTVQARDHAWTILMHDLGVDVPPDRLQEIIRTATDPAADHAPAARDHATASPAATDPAAANHAAAVDHTAAANPAAADHTP
ncbi:hypothetical protein, partial [Catenulispora rubra]|uniref:WXG100-like domain-containing protein n=1 Tax=Catenulispora rubra TaxID=280293 RepID=UPI0018928292